MPFAIFVEIDVENIIRQQFLLRIRLQTLQVHALKKTVFYSVLQNCFNFTACFRIASQSVFIQGVGERLLFEVHSSKFDDSGSGSALALFEPLVRLRVERGGRWMALMVAGRRQVGADVLDALGDARQRRQHQVLLDHQRRRARVRQVQGGRRGRLLPDTTGNS